MNSAKKRILLVDDDEVFVEAIKTALQNRGYEVLIARDGAEGLMRAERDAPDLIVLDVIMPKRSGFSVLDHIHNNFLRMPPIIMVTANDEPRHRDYAESHGVNAFLPKPFEVKELVTKVDALLDA